ncbi:hypothetical protein ACSS6W_005593 [Trichoderma asperelloides]
MGETSSSPIFTRDDYTVGWVCALSTELTASTAMLDLKHEPLSIPSGDENSYTLGSIGKHNIVIACLPKGKQGTTSAAVVAAQMLDSFPSVKFGLMIGIGGGVPTDDHDIRLGDVVVSTPTSSFPGVVQWDMGKAKEGGSFERTGWLNNPPRTLLTALHRLETQHEMEGSSIETYVDEMITRWPRLKQKYARCESLKDILFASDNHHQVNPIEDGRPRLDKENCVSCDVAKSRKRKRRNSVEVHYGLIASGNKVVKDAILRDKLNRDLGGNVLCIEMEAAGLMDSFPCLIIRGISDYADSHKNDAWQGYAAATAAAFAKELLSVIPAHEVKQMDNIKTIVAKVGEISKDVKKIHQGQERHDRNEILEWLTPVNYDAQHHEHLSQRSPGSGKRIFEDKNFQKFLHGDEKTLLCTGNPGAGKTILTSAVIEHLQHWEFSDDALGDKKKVSLAIIYFDFIRKESQRTIDILASLVKQLVRDEPSLLAVIEKLQDKCRRIPAASRSDKDNPEFSKVLKHLISDKSKKVFIVIDALDECANADDFLLEIFTILQDTEAKLFATTRPRESIEKRFKDGLFLEISADSEDVQDYVRGRLSEFKVLSDENLDIRDEIKTYLKREIIAKISNAIDGIFLLAKFHVDSLRAKTTPAQIIETLQVLPRGPDAYQQAYEKTINRIRGQQREHQQLARRVLQWLACAAREITTLELRHALAIRSGSTSLPNEEEFESSTVMVEVCMGLVMIEKESGVIRLLHHTALEYLHQNMMCLWSLEGPKTMGNLLSAPETSKDAMKKAHQGIAEACINYLSFEDIQLQLNRRDWGARCIYWDFNGNKYSGVYPFYSYAERHWAYHWREGFNETSVPDIMSQMTAAFLDNKLMATIIDLDEDSTKDADSEEDEISEQVSGTLTMLHLVAFLGLTSMVDYCLDHGHDIHATTRSGEDALWFALQAQHEGTSRALLERGATEIVVRGFSSLGVAIRNRMRVAADLLLDDHHGARVNPGVERQPLLCRKRLFTALIISARNGHAEITDLLLLHGADVNAHLEEARYSYQCPNYLPPLMAAAMTGYSEVAKMLLERGADTCAQYSASEVSMNLTYPKDATALALAARRGHEAVVESLLRADNINVNVVDDFYGTPFYWAICMGHFAIANTLLSHGGRLHTAVTNLDPGLPTGVSLINGQPSVIRFWGLENAYIDISK